MKESDRYIKIVESSDEGGCHGSDEQDLFGELCQIVDETIQLYDDDGKL